MRSRAVGREADQEVATLAVVAAAGAAAEEVAVALVVGAEAVAVVVALPSYTSLSTPLCLPHERRDLPSALVGLYRGSVVPRWEDRQPESLGRSYPFLVVHSTHENEAVASLQTRCSRLE